MEHEHTGKDNMVNFYAIKNFDVNEGTLSLTYESAGRLGDKLITALMGEGLNCIDSIRGLVDELGFDMGDEELQVGHLLLELDHLDMENLFDGDPAWADKFLQLINNTEFWKEAAKYGIGMHRYTCYIADQEFRKIVFHWSVNARDILPLIDPREVLEDFCTLSNNIMHLGDVHRQHWFGIPVPFFDIFHNKLLHLVERYNGSYAKMAGRPPVQMAVTHYCLAQGRAGAPKNLHFVPVSIVFEEEGN